MNNLFTKVRQLVKLNAKLNVGVNENDLIGGFEKRQNARLFRQH